MSKRKSASFVFSVSSFSVMFKLCIIVTIMGKHAFMGDTEFS